MLGGFILSKGYENFNNSETAFRKSTLIQERIGLVSTHMYKQFLEYWIWQYMLTIKSKYDIINYVYQF